MNQRLVRLRDAGVVLARYLAGVHKPREVWLTFDDGPHPQNTPGILKTMRRYDVRGTFFMIGEHAKRHSDIVRWAADDGHCIGNHSYSHPFLTTLDRAGIQHEVMQADAVLAPYYRGARLFRPPHGDRNDIVDRVASEAGYQTVMWDVSTRDWHPILQPQRWVRLGSLLVRVVGGACIVLMHDEAGTAAHLAEFLDRLQRLDVRFMSPETRASGDAT